VPKRAERPKEHGTRISVSGIEPKLMIDHYWEREIDRDVPN
jgi:hypothetical protein